MQRSAPMRQRIFVKCRFKKYDGGDTLRCHLARSVISVRSHPQKLFSKAVLAVLCAMRLQLLLRVLLPLRCVAQNTAAS